MKVKAWQVGALAAAVVLAAGALASAAQVTTYSIRIDGGLLVPDVPAFAVQGRVFVPVRWIAQALGAQVSVSGHAVDINSGPAPQLVGSSAQDQNGEIVGTVQNTGSTSLNNVQVQAAFWGKDGQVVWAGTEPVTPSTLAAGAQGTFSVPVPSGAAAFEINAASENTIGSTAVYENSGNAGGPGPVPVAVTLDLVRTAPYVPSELYGQVNPPAGDQFLIVTWTAHNLGNAPAQWCPEDWTYAATSSGQGYQADTNADTSLLDNIGCPSNPI
jgi:hypothetical protein